MDTKQTEPIVKRDFNPPEKVSKFSKLKKKLMRKPPKKRLIVISGIGVILVASASFFWFWQSSHQPESYDFSTIELPEPKPEPVDTRVPSPLTGVLVDEKLSQRRVSGVMIENSVDARPQSGLEEAGIVFEAIAEGGITRFLALYQESQPKNIGPIRSARPYYVEWARGFDASYVHSGGSPEALALIRQIGVKDLDHGKYGETLAKRVSYRFAPHNVYTSMATIDSVAKSAGFSESTFTPFNRIDETATEGEDETDDTATTSKKATKVSFDISSSNYNTSYTYDSETKLYKRVMAERPHTDKDSNKQISPRVLVALETTYGINANGIHSVYKTVGSGKITVFQNGEVLTGTWQKKSKTDTLQLLDAKGEPIKLAAGQTWITVVPSGRLSYQ